ncbi:MAG: FIG036672: Nucleoside-diphosphate-sugar epimerase [uncultured Sulfurovum sp.]|uniref:FIG036672: Nucleoside-diphosphate-sugar epimerase n=1 Tax=uncultured Sulfurovum sp. TaxID=269237 RepID=A0A6S6U1Z9_9BACT|nr:MAG: FIG036672: Nucleoside-diphosphate-sugar epimerase [uncultured Sulfurovum sp.]
MKTKKAIITGATGGLGRNLGEFLSKEGWELLGFGRNESIGQELRYAFKAFDLSNLEETLEAFEEADIVFHCAARSSPWGKYEFFYKDNVQATENVLTAMKKYSIPKLVHVSTPSIYFDFSDQINVQESYRPKAFVNAYAQTKYEAEELVLASDVDATIIRPRGIFGEYDSVLIPRLEKIANRGVLPLINKGNALVDVTYVGNVVHAMYLCATKELPTKSIFNISNDEPIEISKLFEMVMVTLGKEVRYKNVAYKTMMRLAIVLEFVAKMGLSKEPMITKYGVGLIAHDQTLDLQRAKDVLGYRPKYSLEEGLERYKRSRVDFDAISSKGNKSRGLELLYKLDNM